ncbi:hypothetical protein [Oceanobacillus manasiensis]|uniref:hypothetical protein n=1 Tax=Oceanobacillus manasiensis TaxID=586413 RepID=UPI0005A99A16|nr:hypothetical protein [Oceanobacillus manasiensis]
MKIKSVLLLGTAGVLAFSIGFLSESENAEAKELPKLDGSALELTDFNNGDQYRVVTATEQEIYEAKGRNITITAEEQHMVENSSDVSGFISQEHGQGFYFKKK